MTAAGKDIELAADIDPHLPPAVLKRFFALLPESILSGDVHNFLLNPQSMLLSLLAMTIVQ